jgi:hypothetical protein
MTETQIQTEEIDVLERLVELHKQRIARLEKQLGRVKRRLYGVIGIATVVGVITTLTLLHYASALHLRFP